MLASYRAGHVLHRLRAHFRGRRRAQVASIVGGEARTDAPGGTPDLHESRRDLDEVVAEVAAGRRVDVRRRRAGRARRAEGVGRGSRSGARAGDRAGRAAGRGQQGGAGRAGHARDRQAVPGGAGRGPGDRRHLRLLPRRGPAAVRADRAVGDAGQAALHVPRCRSASRRSSPRATSRSPCRPGTSCRRSCAATRSCGSRRSTRAALGDALAQAVPRGRRARWRAERRAGVGRGHVRGASKRRWRRAWSTRSASPGRARSARGSASCAGATCSRRAWSSAARTRWS